MKETQLHYFWERSLLPKSRLITSKGENLQILFKGQYNQNEAGPDFLNAHIKIDALEWYGNVEIHLKSSDWKKHGHHLDPQYDNVILHVVFDHDALNDQIIDILPTLIISDFYDRATIESIAKGPIVNNQLLCKNQLNFLSESHLSIIKERILYDRLMKKTKCFRLCTEDPREVLYKLLAESFGRKINKLPFQQLTNAVSFQEIEKRNSDERIEALLNVTYQFKDNRPDHVSFLWKQKGLYPKGFPARRIIQFAVFLSDYDFDYQFTYLSTPEIYHYLVRLMEARSSTLRRWSMYDLSDQLKIGLIVNTFAPFMFWYGQSIESSEICEKAIALLRLTGFEVNSITRIWRNSPLITSSAADSQSYLAIYTQFCSHKKCVVCPIGQQILQS